MQLMMTFGEASPLSPDDILIDGETLIEVGDAGSVTIEGVIGSIAPADCPACVIAASDGTLLVATGFGPVKRMRQNESTLTNAGVPRPTKAPVIKSTADQDGGSAIVVTRTIHFDYSRFGTVFAVFNGSSGVGMHPTTPGAASLKVRQGDFYKYLKLAASLPGEAEYAKKLRLISLFTGTTRVQPGGIPTTRDDWDHVVFDLQVVDESTINGTPGVGVITGRYQAFLRFVDKDGVFSDPSDLSADALLVAEPYVDYANLDVPTDPRVVRRQIWRNDNGQSDVFFLDIDTDDLTSTELRSYHTDAQLLLSIDLPLFDTDGFSLAYLYGEPPYDKPYLAEYVSRVWMAGAIVYTTGNISVTNGSATVVGIGTNWSSYLAGWQFTAGSQQYLVLAADDAAQTLTISPAYQGATEAYAAYSVQPYRGNAQEVQFSGSGQPESFPTDNRLSLPLDNDEVTGFVRVNEALYILKTRHIYRIGAGADPKRDAEIKLAAERGCVSYRCAVPVGGVCFMLDRQGIFAFNGGPAPEQASTPIANLFRRNGDWLRINWQADPCLWHAAHFEEQGIIRWFVAMGSDLRPRNAICLDYRRGRWWVEDYPVWITANTFTNQPELIGRPLLGAEDGMLLTSDLAALDFLPVTTGSRLAIASAAAQSATATTTPPADITGYPLAVVAGPGRGQRRWISSVVGTTIYLDAPWIERPTTESVLQIGAVGYELVSREYIVPKLEQQQELAVAILWQPVTHPLLAFIACLLDGTTYAKNKATATWGAITADADNEEYYKQADLTREEGWGKITLDRQIEYDITRKSTIQLEMTGFSGEERPIISEIIEPGAEG